MQLGIVLTLVQLLLDRAATQTDRWTKRDVVRYDVAEEETSLGIEDFVAAATTDDIDLNSIGIATQSDLEASSDKFEGDIAGLTPETIQEFIANSNDMRKNAINSKWRLWPNGEIPYTISTRYGDYSRRTIAKAMDIYHKKTCVRFVPRDRSIHRDYIYIHPDDGCYSLVGRTGGRQPLSLDVGCILTGTIIHELMHTVGFFHEQSRNDRDDWIRIVWDNVQDDVEDQFEKYSLRTISHLGAQYDYGSIMHYGPYAFTKNGRKTVMAKKLGGSQMGQRDEFSETDLFKIRKLYACPDEEEDTDAVDPNEVLERRTTTITSKPSSTAAPVVSATCKDNNWRCRFWTSGFMGYCKKYERVRTKICPKSCKTCIPGEVITTTPVTTAKPSTTALPPTQSTAKPPVSNCRDKNPNCERWAGMRFCTRSGYTDFMSKTCAKSCNTCPKKQGIPGKKINSIGGTDEECVDNEQYTSQCATAKRLGACSAQRYRQSMLRHCKKTCKLCNN